MNPLFENAIDSLVLGVNFYVENPIANPYKHSIHNPSFGSNHNH
jgi:hypothetical protein